MRALIAIALWWAVAVQCFADEATFPSGGGQALSLVVMDPLAAPLSCPCVEGYAQRQYEKLAEFLTERLGRPVRVTFAESFDKALAMKGCEVIDLAIGKDSVVRHDAATKKIKVTPVAQLTGKNGLTTQTGLILVRSADAAQSIDDLRGYRILFGTAECDEKFAAPRQLLAGVGVEMGAAAAAETTQSCSDGACKIIDWGDAERAAAVISSYAAPLLEGCGTIKKGDLRVVGETDPVPFITAFTTDRVDKELRKAIRAALLDVGKDAELKAALETLNGFVAIDDGYHALRESILQEAASARPAKPASGGADGENTTRATDSPTDEKAASSWPGWRGPTRDGRAPSLPKTLPHKVKIVWRQPLHWAGLGGVAATEEYVIIGDRDLSNSFDVFRCYSAADGEPLWTVEYPAAGKLDYDNTPRATPLVHGDYVYLLGAFGELSCVELATGDPIWRTNLISQFDGDPELVWGVCSSPLVVDEKLIVNPGGPEASVVALDPETGDVLWQSPGDRHAYSSFIVATLGGVRQFVGYDRTTLGGWEIETGRRLWTLTPPEEGDFNVPTPAVAGDRLLVATENNRTRLYGFDNAGRIEPEPIASYQRLAPDISSPIVVGDRAFCVRGAMYCLDLEKGLQPIWIGEDDAFRDYSPLIASDDRVLAVGEGGELILVDATAAEFRIVSRLDLFGDGPARSAEMLSHPALVGTRLYFRGEKELVCVELGPAANGG